MSSPVLNRYVGPKFEEARYEQVDKVAQWLYEVDNAPDETGFRSKLKSFWKRTRIYSVVEKVVAGSKSLFSRLTSRLTPHATPPGSDHSGVKTAAGSAEQVNITQDISASSFASSDAATPSALNRTTSLEDKPLNSPAPSASHGLEPETRAAVDLLIIDDPVSRAEKANEEKLSSSRYKEKEVGKQQDFPEVEVGVVSARVKWLELLFCAEREQVQALEMHELGELALNMGEGKVDQPPNEAESDDESVFDDSPRLFKHRLPEEQPEPWVEPGTVAKGAMWLQPVLSGGKRASRSNGDGEHKNLASPTRLSHGIFR